MIHKSRRFLLCEDRTRRKYHLVIKHGNVAMRNPGSKWTIFALGEIIEVVLKIFQQTAEPITRRYCSILD
jgi:hypothetical protein